MKMPFEESTSRPLTSAGVHRYAPATSGVYGISNAREWIYIGETDNIQSTLLTHLLELETRPLRLQPTGFVFEVCEPATRPNRQDRLVLEYEPFCNRSSPRNSKDASGTTMTANEMFARSAQCDSF
jgi:hypothetical protein